MATAEVSLGKAAKYIVSGNKVALTCDSERCDKKTAVSFCVDCNMKVCDTHQQFHDEMFGSRHEVISVKEYQESPGKYKKTFCEQHKMGTSIKACKQCHEVVCKKCDRAECECKVDPTKITTEPTKVPSSLTLSATIDTGSKCRSVNHRSNGDIMVVDDENSLSLFSKRTRELTKLDVHQKPVYVAIEHNQAIYILHAADFLWKIVKYSPDFSHSEEIFEFQKFPVVPIVTVSDKHLIVLNPRRENGVFATELYFYNRVTKKCSMLDDGKTVQLSRSPEGELLVAARRTMAKCTLGDEFFTPAWLCRDLPDLFRICTDKSGLIYATTRTKRSIYIISSDGEKLTELHHDELPTGLSGQFSVKDDELVVPGWEDKKMYIFKLNYES